MYKPKGTYMYMCIIKYLIIFNIRNIGLITSKCVHYVKVQKFKLFLLELFYIYIYQNDSNLLSVFNSLRCPQTYSTILQIKTNCTHTKVDF